MENKHISIAYTVCRLTELPAADRHLVEQARAACQTSYAPYSKFCVGAAVALANGETICGSNQENAAYPSGTCAERCTMFYANARYPHTAPVAIAIAACDGEGRFTPTPITPCGACRQVLLETETRFNHPLRVLLCGEHEVYILDSVRKLLPFSFDASAL